jgi:hypothetical protein
MGWCVENGVYKVIFFGLRVGCFCCFGWLSISG